MAKQSRASARYVCDCCGATKTSLRSNPLATYVKETFAEYKKHSNRVLWVIEFVS